jgi:site-specific recombinase XerD
MAGVEPTAPGWSFPVPKGDRPAQPLRPEEIRALLLARNGDSLSSVRDHALLVVLWRSGLRCSEALALVPADVDFTLGAITVRRGKGRRARVAGIDDAALAVVSVWMSAREVAGIDGAAPLFCRLRGQPGAPLSSRYVRAMMVRLAEKAGVRRRAHPHALRHSLAFESVQEGMPITKISRQLGHSSIATTQVYCDHLLPADVVDAYRSRAWA